MLRTLTPFLRALLFLLVLLGAGPVGAQPAWQWASGPTAVPATTISSAVNVTAVDAAGNVVVTGYFKGGLTLGNFVLTSAGGRDIFVARLSPTGV